MMIHSLSESSPSAPAMLPLIENGDRLSQAEFHHRYGLMQETFRADLIAGTVYVTSLLHHEYSKHRLLIGTPVFLYEGCTDGVEASERATVILGEEDEVHPDLILRLRPECGGRSWVTEDEDVVGPPDLIFDVATSPRALEFHLKMDRYRRAGVEEYVILCLEEWRVHWFHLQLGTEQPPDPEGIFRSRSFPGLWIDGPALLERQPARLLEVLDHGLATEPYTNFRDRLAHYRNRHLSNGQ